MTEIRPLHGNLSDIIKKDLELFEFLLEDLSMTRAQVESAMDAKNRAQQAEFEERLRTSRTAANE